MAVRGYPQDSDNRTAQAVAAHTEVNSSFELQTWARLFRGRARGSVRKIRSAEAVSKSSRTFACAPTRSVAHGVLRRFELARSRQCNGRLDRQCSSALRTGQ